MNDMETTSLHLSPACRAGVCSWAEADYPAEACGLLVGRRCGDRVEVFRVTHGRNRLAARGRDCYEMDPDDVRSADDEARRQGLDLVGVWHSHPDHEASPSARDGAAAWRGWSYLIVAVGARGVTELRSWQWQGEAFTPERIEA